MAIHTELPIYKVAYDLLGVVVQLVRNMPREFKQSIGGKIRDECIEIATLVFRANVTPSRAAWHGDRGHYAAPGGHVKAEELEQAVLEQLAADFSRREVIAAFTREVRALQESLRDARDLIAAKAALADVETRARRLTTLLEESSEPAPLLRRLEELEGERRQAADRVARTEAALADARVVTAITEADVERLLAGMAGSLAELRREALKDALRGWLGRVELDPATRKGRITYRLSLARDKVASPRRSGVIPDLLAAGPTFVVARHRRAATSRARC